MKRIISLVALVISFTVTIAQDYQSIEPRHRLCTNCLPQPTFENNKTYLDPNKGIDCNSSPCTGQWTNPNNNSSLYGWGHIFNVRRGVSCGTDDIRVTGPGFCEFQVVEQDLSINLKEQVVLTRLSQQNYYGQFRVNYEYIKRSLIENNCDGEVDWIKHVDVCVIKPAGQWGTAGVQTPFVDAVTQVYTVRAKEDGTARVDFFWQGESGYCNEIFFTGGQMNVVMTSMNGVAVNQEFGWRSTFDYASDKFGGVMWNMNEGDYQFVVKIKDKFGNEYFGNTISVKVAPSCYGSIPSSIEVLSDNSNTADNGSIEEINGGYVNGNNDGGYKLEANKTYQINLTEKKTSFPDFWNSYYVPLDFCSHYDVVTDDGKVVPSQVNSSTSNTSCSPDNKIGGEHLELTYTGTPGRYNLRVTEDIGSFRIYAVKKQGLGTYCYQYNPINIFVGGQNINSYSPCLIYLPRDLSYLKGFEEVQSKFGIQYVLSHFNYALSSAQGIIVQSDDPNYPDGVILEDGAVLKIEVQYDQPDEEKVDNNRNWVQKWSYDDDGRVIAESKQFFNNGGRATQLQAKNLSQKIVLASETIYDKFGRPAITTLPAPVRFKSFTGAGVQCGDDIRAGADMFFIYKNDFITSNNQSYNYSNFDSYLTINKANNPDPLDALKPGTLGWYYGNNNRGGTPMDLSKGEQMFLEPYVASTSYPYSKTIYDEDGTNEIKSTTLPGDYHKQGSGHEGLIVTIPVDASDHSNPSDPDSPAEIENYLEIRNTYLFPNDVNKPVSLINEAFKASYKDQNGKEGLAYYDRTGKVIIEKNVEDGIRTYNYYDDAGRLVCSISPNGLEQLNIGSAFNTIDKTTYKYNHRGWLLEISQIDEGITKFMYRKDGTLRYSQNARQREEGKFSYVTYDEVGRLIETGEFTPDVTLASPMTFGSSALKATLEMTSDNYQLTSGGTKSEAIYTVYDLPDQTAYNENKISEQYYLMSKVSYTYRDNGTKTWYSYDEKGRIVWVAQDLPGLGIKKVEYNYTPAGVVSEVAYQAGQEDAFYHFYYYDADMRLEEVFTSKRGDLPRVYGKRQAAYSYYVHGPLKHVEYSDNIQGIDYVYTAQGWLKSINHYDKAKDPGHDGDDVFGMTLDYFNGDYTKTGTDIGHLSGTGTAQHFNGNIQTMTWFTQRPPSDITPVTTVAYNYTYDNRYQLNNAIWGNVSNGAYAGAGNKYREGGLTYDANGNIKSLKRYDVSGNLLHDFTNYIYEGNSNKLQSIEGYNTSYTYNPIGQLKSVQNVSGTTYAAFDHYGRMTSISTAEDGSNPSVKFYYDNNGHRYKKETYSIENQSLLYTTYYVSDISGKILAIYDDNGDIGNNDDKTDDLVKKETPVYGMDRIGVYFDRGNITQYELKDHLGNVRATITQLNNVAVVESYADYYPFGQVLSYHTSSDVYRFGYQGQFAEKDSETGYNAFELRMYDPVIGRWLSVDPNNQYFSPYLAMGNNPVISVDPTGGTAECNTCPKPEDYKGGIPNGALWIDWETEDENNGYRWNGNTWENVVIVFQMEEVVIGNGSGNNDYDGDGTDWHAQSQNLRKVSGGLLAVSLPLQQAFARANLYSKATQGRSALVIFEKTVLGKKIIHQPLFEMNAQSAGKWGNGLKVASKVVGVAGVAFAMVDIGQNGFNTSNSLDLIMSGMALTGVGSGVAATYFILNAGTTILTGQSIGQHIDSFIEP